MKQHDVSKLGLDGLTSREWLVSNQIGGYASSSLCGMNTRKYHGILVAAMSAPVRRMVLLSRVEERVLLDGWPIDLACNQYPGAVFPSGHAFLRAFDEDPFPRWAYQGDGWTIEKSLQLVRGQNTVLLSYSLLGGRKAISFEVRPLLALRGMHKLSFQRNIRLNVEPSRVDGVHRVVPTSSTPEVFFSHDGKFTFDPCWYLSTIYRREQERGYAGLEDVWCPGVVRWTILPGETIRFVCSTDPVGCQAVVDELERQSVTSVVVPEAHAAQDDDVVALARSAEVFRLKLDGVSGAMSDQTDGILAQFPWASPNLRDALIAAPGILLACGKFVEARSMIDSLLPTVRGGMLPTEFSEDASEPIYDGADVGLWLVKFAGEYLEQTHDDKAAGRWFEPLSELVRDLQNAPVCPQSSYPVLERESGEHCPAGDLGVSMSNDGLLVSGAPGRATTWMNARPNERAVTPRTGAAVEVNALWYNAICVVRDLAGKLGRERWVTELSALALRVQESFNRVFWNGSQGCCYDVIDGTSSDPSIRPNQLLAISLPHPVLDRARWNSVLDVVVRRLLTARGVRTLSCDDPAYRGRYVGDIVRRDHAYHQGSAFVWWLGPLVSAFVRSQNRTLEARTTARKWLAPCLEFLGDQGVGHLPELFDGDAPHHPGGSIADARGVGELLRCHMQDLLDVAPVLIDPKLMLNPAPSPAQLV